MVEYYKGITKTAGMPVMISSFPVIPAYKKEALRGRLGGSFREWGKTAFLFDGPSSPIQG
jgi:hypothetical protein